MTIRKMGIHIICVSYAIAGDPHILIYYYTCDLHIIIIYVYCISISIIIIIMILILIYMRIIRIFICGSPAIAQDMHIIRIPIFLMRKFTLSLIYIKNVDNLPAIKDTMVSIILYYCHSTFINGGGGGIVTSGKKKLVDCHNTKPTLIIRLLLTFPKSKHTMT